jgi:hypothetical protein
LTIHLSPAKEPLGPFRSIETFALPLHCAPSSQVSLIAETPNTRVSAIKKALWAASYRRAELARFLLAVRITCSPVLGRRFLGLGPKPTLPLDLGPAFHALVSRPQNSESNRRQR